MNFILFSFLNNASHCVLLYYKMVEKDSDIALKLYCNAPCNMEAGNIYDDDDVDGILCDCIIITDDNDR